MTREFPTRNVETADGLFGGSTVFDLLSYHQRRLVIEFLATEAETVDIDVVATEVASHIDPQTAERIDAIRASLHHQHLPKLDDAGVLDYDSPTGTVRADPQITALRPYLELARDEGFEHGRSGDVSPRW